MLNGRVLLFWVRGRRLEITPALLTMPLFSNLPAGSAHEGHRHGTTHGTDLLGVVRMTIWALYMGVLLFIHFSDCRVESDGFLKLFSTLLFS